MSNKTLTAVLSLALVISLAGCGPKKADAPAAGGSEASKSGAAPTADQGPVKVDPATAGVIKGKVTYSGSAPKVKPIDMTKDATCVKLHPMPVMDEAVMLGDGGAIANAIVYIKSGPATMVMDPVPTTEVILDQHGCMYMPHVFALRAGQPIVYRNSDDGVTHNIHIASKYNGTWNFSQAGKGDEKGADRQIKNAEVFRFNCDVHPWMNCFVGCFKHNYFVVTGKDGMFELKNVPPGDYTVGVIHEKLNEGGEKTAKCKVDAKGTAEVKFDFDS